MDRNRHSNSLAIAFAIVFPSLVTWAYFVLLAGEASSWQQMAYGIGKAIQFAFPLAWVVLVCKENLRLARPSFSGLGWGLGFGLLVLVVMLAVYFQLKPSGFFRQTAGEVQQKIAELGVDTLPRFVCLGIFYAIAHSLLEEYYWRWFVFGRLRRQCSLFPAITISSLGFMAHHVILLATYFQWHSPVTYLFSLGVAAGGAVWAWIYEKTGTLYGPWLSHMLVDAGIFIIGYDLARQVFQSS